MLYSLLLYRLFLPFFPCYGTPSGVLLGDDVIRGSRLPTVVSARG